MCNNIISRPYVVTFIWFSGPVVQINMHVCIALQGEGLGVSILQQAKIHLTITQRDGEGEERLKFAIAAVSSLSCAKVQQRK